MDDEEFDQVTETIFDGVTSIERIGLPGVLIPMRVLYYVVKIPVTSFRSRHDLVKDVV
jgi:hypothetical protein